MAEIILNSLLPTIAWWEYSPWHPSLAEFGGMVAFMFWWCLAALIAVIPLGIFIYIFLLWILEG